MPCGSVRNFKELFDDPQLAAREMIARVEHATIGQLQALGVPVKLSDTPGAVRSRRRRSASTPMRCCERDLGFSADAIAALRRQQVI